MTQTTGEDFSSVLHGVTEDVFQSVLGMNVKPATAVDLTVAPALTVTVRFHGTGQGAVMLELSMTLAQQLSAAMLCLDDPAENDDAMVRDAMGEVVNIIAGNFKAACSSDFGLSVPDIADGPPPILPPDQQLHRNALACADETFFISAWIA